MKATGKKLTGFLLILCMVLAMMPAVPESAQAESVDTPLVVAYGSFSQKFSPFYADTAYDRDVVAMTQLRLLTTDRTGGIICNAIEGETVRYYGTDYTYTGPADVSVKYQATTDTTKYTAKIRSDLKFSDGVPVTIDDVIFTYYTLLDAAYSGPSNLEVYDIVGLRNYRTQTTDEVYEKYAAMADKMLEDGRGQGYIENEVYTEELYNAYWATIDENIATMVQCIHDYVNSTYADDGYAPMIGKETYAEIGESDGLKMAYAMRLWGFGKLGDDGMFHDALDINEWDLVDTFPTIDDFIAAVKGTYGDDIVGMDAERTGTEGFDSISGDAKAKLICTFGPKDEAMGGRGIKYIEGIKRIDDYTVEVTVNGYSASAVYSILDISIAPMHYYGSTSKYNYAKGMFGFDRGDLSKVRKMSRVPMGAGPYTYESYENGVVTFKANKYWYKGKPKIKEIRFKEINSVGAAAAVSAGYADAGEITGSRTRFEEVASYNSNGEITGDVITTSRIDYRGYGYIGLNADTVNIGGKSDSAKSKALRKALATVLAVYRDVAYDSYYGDTASVIQYPISSTSWAAPQPTDAGYRIAFSVDANGNDIYTADMTAEQKYDAAKAAALTWFEAAGYTVKNGKVTKAPKGGKKSFEVIIPGDGTGDHPSYTVLAMAKEALESIGIELIINDPADVNELWSALDAGTQELWCAAWSSTIDPDMYQVYHGNNIVGKGGTDSNHYHIDDEKLNELIMKARVSTDQAYRKKTYRKCMDIIADWAVEIPAYQRHNAFLFSTERINISTLTPDITTSWGWMNDIEKLEMNPVIIKTQPKDTTAAIGKTVKLKVKAVGAHGEKVKYQWYYRTSPTAKWKKASGTSATKATYKFKATAKKNGYQYRCKLTGTDGSIYTEIINLKTGKAPKIETQPVDKSVKTKTKVKLKVVATGEEMTYQWYYRVSSKGKWKKATGKSATKATYSFTATTKKSGYQYRCMISNPYGKVYTETVKLKVRK